MRGLSAKGTRLTPIDRRELLKNALALFVGFVLAFASEIVIFNFSALETRELVPLKPMSITGTSQGDAIELSLASSASAQATFDFSREGVRLETIHLHIDDPSEALALKGTLAISLVDQGNTQGHDVASVEIASLVEHPWIRVYPSGRVFSLTLRLVGEATGSEEGASNLSAEAPKLIVTPTFNEPSPLSVQWGRVAVMWLFLAACWMLRPSSFLYAQKLGRGLPLYAVAFVLGVFLALACVANQGHTKTAVNDQYDALARSLVHGELSLDYEVAPWLSTLENPYDFGARDEAKGEYYFDTAYYDVRYYMYFGALPTFLFSLPYRLLTGQDFGTLKMSCAICVLLPLALATLTMALIKRWMPKASLALAYLVFATLVVGTWSVYIATNPNIYCIPYALSLVLVACGLSLWIEATKGPIRAGLAFLGSLLMALTLFSRLVWFAYAALGLPLVVGALRRESPQDAIPKVALAVVPFVVVGFFALWYNAARFGSPFEFGARYNLTLSDLSHDPKSILLGFLGVFAFLFQPPNLSLTEPLFHETVVAQGFNGYLYVSFPKGGTLLLFPVLLFGLLVFSRRMRACMKGEAQGVAWIGLAIAVALAFLDANNGGIHARYALDSAFGLAMACAMVVVSLWKGRSADVTSADFAQRHSDGALDFVQRQKDGACSFGLHAFAFCALLAVSVVVLLVWWPWPWHLMSYIS